MGCDELLLQAVLHGEPALRTAVTHGASAQARRAKLPSTQTHTVRAATAHHAACLLTVARLK